MKVLICERCLEGHRSIYIMNLANSSGVETYLYAPENVGCAENHYIPYDNTKDFKSLSAYFKWICSIRKIVKEYEIDLGHIPDGDSIRRFFGLGFDHLGTSKVVLTCHHFFSGKLSELSYRSMSGGGKRVIVGHTRSVCSAFQRIGVSNVYQVDYPAFDMEKIQNLDTRECKSSFGIPNDAPLIAIVGGLVAYKRILPFLDTLGRCKQSFRLLVCGSESDLRLLDIQNATAQYAQNTTLMIRRLTDDEYHRAIMAADIIYSVYGLDFDGASGPLTDGVSAGKMILASNHGSLGQIVEENHLGVTCDCMDAEDVLRATEQALSIVEGFAYDRTAQDYKKKLSPDCFARAYERIYVANT